MQTHAAKPKSARPKVREAARPAAQEMQAAQCPACGCTEHHVVRPLPRTIYSGYHAGRPYTSIERKRVRCDDCKQTFIRTQRVYEPSAWRGPLPPTREEQDS